MKTLRQESQRSPQASPASLRVAAPSDLERVDQQRQAVQGILKQGAEHEAQGPDRAVPLPASSPAGGQCVPLAIPARVRAAVERATRSRLAGVTVYRGELPAEAPRAVAATYGRGVLLAPSAPSLSTLAGQLVLSHELGHALSQPAASGRRTFRETPPAWSEAEANRVMLSTLGLAPEGPVPSATHAYWAGCDDMPHRVIEENALAGVFSAEEISILYQGNLQTDYSQLPSFANLLLLGIASVFGGYWAVHHFDEYEWDKTIGKFTKRNAWRAITGSVGIDPIEYIEELLTMSVTAPHPKRLMLIGHALHVIEDFFAHTNFLELAKLSVEERQKQTLFSGSFAASDQKITLAEKLASYTDSKSLAFLASALRKQAQSDAPMSHSAVAKDNPRHPGFLEAVAMATGLVHDVGLLMRAALAGPQASAGAETPSDAETPSSPTADPLAQAKSLIRSRLRPPEGNWEDGWWQPYIKNWSGKLAGLRHPPDKLVIWSGLQPGSAREFERNRVL